MHPGFSSQTWPWPGLSSVMESSFGQNRAEFPKSVPTCPQNLPLWMLHTCSCCRDVHEQGLASPTMTISCQVNTPGQKILFLGTFTLSLIIPTPLLSHHKKIPDFVLPILKLVALCMNQKDCKHQLITSTQVAWHPSLSLRWDVSMQPVAPTIIMKNPPCSVWKARFG